MRILDRYIGLTVLTHTLMVLLVLLSMYFFSSLVSELGSVGKGKYSAAIAVQYSLMLLPRQAYELFPLVALLGGMLGLGTLASSNELTVVRAAGVSVRRIMLAVMKTALLLMVAVALVGELVAPRMEQQARVMRSKAMSQNLSFNIKEGLWARDGDTYIHIQRLLAGGRAHGVSLYIFDRQRQLRETVRAQEAVYENGAWLLRRAVRSLIASDHVQTSEVAEQRWRSVLTPEVINVTALPPERLAVNELAGYVSYSHANNLEANVYELALWTRIVLPFATGGMMLLAVPFVFGSLRSVGIGLRITVGGLLGIGFYIFNGMFGRIALIYDLSPLFSAVAPTLIVYGLWWVLMRRVQ